MTIVQQLVDNISSKTYLTIIILLCQENRRIIINSHLQSIHQPFYQVHFLHLPITLRISRSLNKLIHHQHPAIIVQHSHLTNIHSPTAKTINHSTYHKFIQPPFLINMNYSIPKTRHLSKENLYDKKHYGARLSEKTNFFSILTSGNILQDKPMNRPLIRRQSEDVLVKKVYPNQAFKPLGSILQVDAKYSQLNKKIKDILDQQDLNNRPPPRQPESLMNRSTILRRAESTTKDLPQNNHSALLMQKRQSPLTTLPNANLYFLECLKRKNSITTQFYINVHTSILTFRQFYKLAHQCKPKTPDPLIPPPTPNRKTIVFDMDETLIHTSEVMTPGYEIKVPFKAFQGKVSSGFVNVRPYAKQLIKKLSKHFDIIIFTAGNKCYADPILDHLDPTGAIQHRLYRESCTFVANQLFVKDLRILGRPLEHVLLVDNAPHSYMLQLPNGIPILNYFKGKDDNQLYYLEKYLMTLLEVEDVRTPNAEYFRLHEYTKFDNHDKLINALYAKRLVS